MTNSGVTATTNTNGQYTITDLVTGTYTITPSTAGYVFTPTLRTVSVPPDATGQDFVASVVASDGLVAYYPFNGNANDASGNAQNLLTRGTPLLVTDKDGVPDQAYAFNGGSDQLYYPTGIFQTTPSAYTISTWFKANQTSGGNYFVYEASSGIYYRMRIADHYLELGQSPDTGDFIEVRAPFTDTISWHHAVLKWDGSQVYGYLDGRLIGSAAISSTNTWDLGFSVSGAGTSTNNPFNGSIDEVRVYNRALSDAEIQALYGEQVIAYSISGRIADVSDAPLDGVTVSTNSGITRTTNASGQYTITGLVTGTFTITPSKASYVFTPTIRTVSVPPDATGQDFVGSTEQTSTYGISGTINDSIVVK